MAIQRLWLLSASVAPPGGASVPEAEAWGARLAMALLMRAPLGTGGAAIAGDNPLIIRHCAGCARVSSPSVAPLLEAPLGLLASAGRVPLWTIIRRSQNKDAHNAAYAAGTHGRAHWLLGERLAVISPLIL